RDDVVILVNGQNIAHEKGLDTELDEQDDVAIFPPVSGG
ncbi:MAG: MoaD/ThiS family protein, partial [Thermoplasmata archaeon]|nr:MoaD/ThiS family protein [Thermoplasmata archaeon]